MAIIRFGDGMKELQLIDWQSVRSISNQILMKYQICMIGISMDDLEPIPSPVQEIGGKYM